MPQEGHPEGAGWSRSARPRHTERDGFGSRSSRTGHRAGQRPGADPGYRWQASLLGM